MNDEHVEENTTEGAVPCVLLPLVNKTALVPTVTLAEMAPLKPFDMIHSTPDWFLGFYDWHGTRVPVISFETINELGSPKISVGGRVAILNCTGVDDKVKYISIITQSTPNMIDIEEANIQEDSGAEKSQYDMMSVTVDSECYVVPDIAALEKAFLNLSIHKDIYF